MENHQDLKCGHCGSGIDDEVRTCLACESVLDTGEDLTETELVHKVKEMGLETLAYKLSRGNDSVANDLKNVALLTISKYYKVFNYCCRVCREVFSNRSDLVTHCRETHRIRGNCELVTLQKFVETITKLAMRRTAFRRK